MCNIISPRNSRVAWFFLAVLLAAAILRFQGLGSESFWLDEVLSAKASARPFSRILSAIPPDKPPLDYFVQAVFTRINPRNPEFWNRVPGALAGVLVLPGVYALGRLIANRRIAFLAFVFASFSPLLVYYSGEARPYSLFLLIATWQMVLFFLSIQNRGRTFSPRALAQSLGLLLLSILMMYTLYAGFIVLGVELLYLVFLMLAGRRRRLYATRSGIFLAVFALTIIAILPMRNRAELYPSEDLYWKFQGFSADLYLSLSGSFFARQHSGTADRVVQFFGLLCIIAGAFAAFRVGNRRMIFPVTMVVVGIYLLTILYSVIDRYFAIRYTFQAVPFVMILFACLAIWIARFFPRRMRNGVVYTIMGLYVCWSIHGTLANRPARRDWRAAIASFADEYRAGDRVIVPQDMRAPVQYYLGRFGIEEAHVYLQGLVPPEPTLSTTWMITVDGDLRKPRPGFNGVIVERQSGSAPGVDYTEMLKHLVGGHRMPVGSVPGELLGEGWAAPEDWGREDPVRWINGNKAFVFMPVEDAGAGTLTIHLFPYEKREVEGDQQMALLVNDVILETRTIHQGGFHDVSWEVDEGVIRRGYNVIGIYVAISESPSMSRLNYGDFRALSVAVDTVTWERHD